MGEPSERVADYLGHSHLGLSGPSFEVARAPDRAEVCVDSGFKRSATSAHVQAHCLITFKFIKRERILATPMADSHAVHCSQRLLRRRQANVILF